MSSSARIRRFTLAGLAIAVLAGATPTWLHADTIYVDDDGPNDPAPGDPAVGDPAEDGSAAHPFDAIQEGIDAAAIGDQVVVLDGTYIGPGNRDLDFGGKAITVRSVSGPENCTIDCELAGRGFLFANNETAAARVDGLTITNGSAAAGGGFYCYWSDPTVINCIVASCTADVGGGVYCENSNLTMSRCTITGSSAGSYGGGLAGVGAQPSVTLCSFVDGQAGLGGGGVFLYAVRGLLEKCSVTGNSAEEGGGVYCAMGDRTLIRHCTLRGNVATSNGGGLASAVSTTTVAGGIIMENTAVAGGGIYCYSGDPRITGCAVLSNDASARGGGIACVAGGIPTLSACTIAANHALLGGAAHCDEASRPTFTDCLITGNTANAATVYPRQSSVPALYGCTVAGNDAGAIGAIYCAGTVVVIGNSILWDNLPQEIYTGNGQAQVTYSDVAGSGTWPGEGNINIDPAFVGGPSGVWTGNATYDPATGQTTFVDGSANWPEGALAGMFLNPDINQGYQPLIADNTATTITVWGDYSALGHLLVLYQVYDYHLTESSPTIDAGDPDSDIPLGATDIDGDDRLRDGDGDGEAVVDMGADEYVRFFPGDLNCDGEVNAYDIDPFTCVLSPNCDYQELYPHCDPSLADCNGDGIANAYDIDPFIALIGD